MGKKRQIREALANVGDSLSQREIDRIQRDLGVSSGVKKEARDLGITIGRSNSGSSSLGVQLPNFENQLAAPEFEFQAAAALVGEQGKIDTAIARLNAAAAKASARIEARANRYTADRNLQGTQYSADRELEALRYQADRQLESALGVENIRTKGEIDLQGIVNAGLERVENIRGEYGLKGKMLDRGTSIYGGLVNAFNFS